MKWIVFFCLMVAPIATAQEVVRPEPKSLPKEAPKTEAKTPLAADVTQHKNVVKIIVVGETFHIHDSFGCVWHVPAKDQGLQVAVIKLIATKTSSEASTTVIPCINCRPVRQYLQR
jgi:hypothetical protein